jgi:hypothetical protein
VWWVLRPLLNNLIFSLVRFRYQYAVFHVCHTVLFGVLPQIHCFFVIFKTFRFGTHPTFGSFSLSDFDFKHPFSSLLAGTVDFVSIVGF